MAKKPAYGTYKDTDLDGKLSVTFLSKFPYVVVSSREDTVLLALRDDYIEDCSIEAAAKDLDDLNEPYKQGVQQVINKYRGIY